MLSGVVEIGRFALIMTWQKITQGVGDDGLYFVAGFNPMANAMEVSISSCRDGHWRTEPWFIPVAWMPMPEPPTLTSLGLESWAKEKADEWR